MRILGYRGLETGAIPGHAAVTRVGENLGGNAGLLFLRARLPPTPTHRFLPVMDPALRFSARSPKFHTCFSSPLFPLPQFFSRLKAHRCLAFAGPDIGESVSFAE